MESKELTELIMKTLSEKKGEDIIYANVSEKTILADYFIFATGRSTTHVRSLCEYADEAVEKAGMVALRKEGVAEGRWAVMDFGTVILHVFDDSSRDFYHLERLWGDGIKYESDSTTDEKSEND